MTRPEGPPHQPEQGSVPDYGSQPRDFGREPYADPAGPGDSLPDASRIDAARAAAYDTYRIPTEAAQLFANVADRTLEKGGINLAQARDGIHLPPTGTGSEVDIKSYEGVIDRSDWDILEAEGVLPPKGTDKVDQEKVYDGIALIVVKELLDKGIVADGKYAAHDFGPPDRDRKPTLLSDRKPRQERHDSILGFKAGDPEVETLRIDRLVTQFIGKETGEQPAEFAARVRAELPTARPSDRLTAAYKLLTHLYTPGVDPNVTGPNGSLPKGVSKGLLMNGRPQWKPNPETGVAEASSIALGGQRMRDKEAPKYEYEFTEPRNGFQQRWDRRWANLRNKDIPEHRRQFEFKPIESYRDVALQTDAKVRDHEARDLDWWDVDHITAEAVHDFKIALDRQYEATHGSAEDGWQRQLREHIRDAKGDDKLRSFMVSTVTSGIEHLSIKTKKRDENGRIAERLQVEAILLEALAQLAKEANVAVPASPSASKSSRRSGPSATSRAKSVFRDWYDARFSSSPASAPGPDYSWGAPTPSPTPGPASPPSGPPPARPAPRAYEPSPAAPPPSYYSPPAGTSPESEPTIIFPSSEPPIGPDGYPKYPVERGSFTNATGSRQPLVVDARSAARRVWDRVRGKDATRPSGEASPAPAPYGPGPDPHADPITVDQRLPTDDDEDLNNERRRRPSPRPRDSGSQPGQAPGRSSYPDPEVESRRRAGNDPYGRR